ncbi:wax ester/triacylglycerol synthase domain-containing protein [Nonomuraea endophytica]|uniref:wax ester/triacylglycerol synthase domain-containing protein n=1 Tax=Nonomuraea endophytica TaxID=714136 RepID=UPI0037C66AB8
MIDRTSSADLTNLVIGIGIGSVPMQVGAVLMMDSELPLDLAAAREVIARRACRVARLRQRLIHTPPGCGRPIWVRDAAFDIRGHVREVACPSPADEHALLDVVAALVMRPLLLTRPLWSATFVTGLSNGQSALVLVMHHVLADGIGGLAVLANLVDGVTTSLSSAPKPRTPSVLQLAVDAWAGRLRSLRHPVGHLRRLRSGLAELGSPRTLHAPSSSLNQPTGAHRHLAVVRADLEAVHQLARRHQASVNDVVLSAVTAALHTLMNHRGERIEEFVVSVPVSARTTASATHLGNQVGTMAVLLPATGDPRQRLEQIAAITRTRKATSHGSSAAVLSPLFRALSAAGVLGWFMNHQRMINTYVTNLRGPAGLLTFGGSVVREIIPVSGAHGNVTVTFTVLSYAGALAITVVADRERCPDLPILVAALEAELDSLISSSTSRR